MRYITNNTLLNRGHIKELEESTRFIRISVTEKQNPNMLGRKLPAEVGIPHAFINIWNEQVFIRHVKFCGYVISIILEHPIYGIYISAIDIYVKDIHHIDL